MGAILLIVLAPLGLVLFLMIQWSLWSIPLVVLRFIEDLLRIIHWKRSESMAPDASGKSALPPRGPDYEVGWRALPFDPRTYAIVVAVVVCITVLAFILIGWAAQ